MILNLLSLDRNILNQLRILRKILMVTLFLKGWLVSVLYTLHLESAWLRRASLPILKYSIFVVFILELGGALQKHRITEKIKKFGFFLIDALSFSSHVSDNHACWKN